MIISIHRKTPNYICSTLCIYSFSGTIIITIHLLFKSFALVCSNVRSKNRENLTVETNKIHSAYQMFKEYSKCKLNLWYSNLNLYCLYSEFFSIFKQKQKIWMNMKNKLPKIPITDKTKHWFYKRIQKKPKQFFLQCTSLLHTN